MSMVDILFFTIKRNQQNVVFNIAAKCTVRIKMCSGYDTVYMIYNCDVFKLTLLRFRVRYNAYGNTLTAGIQLSHHCLQHKYAFSILDIELFGFEMRI